ncbi:hypothetical protein D3C72_1942820 [compost metagenome]
MVEDGAALDRRHHAGQQATDGGEHQRAQRQFQRRREQGGEFAPHALLGFQRGAQVALEQVADVVEVLDIQRLIQTQTLHRRRVQGGVKRTLPHHHFDGIARDHADQAEGNQRDAEKCRNQYAKTTQDKEKHVKVSRTRTRLA